MTRETVWVEQNQWLVLEHIETVAYDRPVGDPGNVSIVVFTVGGTRYVVKGEENMAVLRDYFNLPPP